MLARTNKDNTLSVLTYNVWTGNDKHPKNQQGLVDYIAANTPDIICLQEVTEQFYHLLVCHDSLRADYDFIQPEPHRDADPYDGELLMVKKKFNATLTRQILLKDGKQGRYFAYGVITLNDTKIAIATAHLESQFFSDTATDIKRAQLFQIHKKLQKTGADFSIFAGDANFTGGEQLELEDTIVDELGLIDTWKVLHPTSDNDLDENFRLNDATWDSARNRNVIHKNEFHRPDRIFMRFFNDNKEVELAEMDRVVNELSDHYGLMAKIKLSSSCE